MGFFDDYPTRQNATGLSDVADLRRGQKQRTYSTGSSMGYEELKFKLFNLVKKMQEKEDQDEDWRRPDWTGVELLKEKIQRRISKLENRCSRSLKAEAARRQEQQNNEEDFEEAVDAERDVETQSDGQADDKTQLDEEKDIEMTDVPQEQSKVLFFALLINYLVFILVFFFYVINFSKSVYFYRLFISFIFLGLWRPTDNKFEFFLCQL